MAAICARILADMSQILDELLDFSALVAGRAQLTLSRFSLPTLFEEIVSQWQPVAEEGGMIFTSQCDPALGEIVSDQLKLRQIAGNLLSNAIKYRKPAQGGDVGVSFSADGTTGWKLVVEDMGIGIAREDMQALFGEFNRIRPNSAVPGTRLGLAMCEEFAELLGGGRSRCIPRRSKVRASKSDCRRIWKCLRRLDTRVSRGGLRTWGGAAESSGVGGDRALFGS